jgi:hypothetical protein
MALALGRPPPPRRQFRPRQPKSRKAWAGCGSRKLTRTGNGLGSIRHHGAAKLWPSLSFDQRALSLSKKQPMHAASQDCRKAARCRPKQID